MAKLYTIETAKPIACLGNIQGPLTTPTALNFTDVLNMINKGFVIYEHNPAKIGEKVRVTKANIKNIVFPTSRAKAGAERALNREVRMMEQPLAGGIVGYADKKIDNKDYTIAPKSKSKLPVESKMESVSKPDAFTKS